MRHADATGRRVVYLWEQANHQYPCRSLRANECLRHTVCDGAVKITEVVRECGLADGPSHEQTAKEQNQCDDG